jgi:hypothetical protein
LSSYGLHVTKATPIFSCTLRDQQLGQCDNRDYTYDYHDQHDFQQRETFVSLSQKSHHFLLPPFLGQMQPMASSLQRSKAARTHQKHRT